MSGFTSLSFDISFLFSYRMFQEIWLLKVNVSTLCYDSQIVFKDSNNLLRFVEIIIKLYKNSILTIFLFNCIKY